MPFTGSHPAAVVPLMRLGLVPSALVIGSMAPDLPYYLPLGLDSHTTHSTSGVLGVDLLLGLVSFVVWQRLVGPLTVALAPDVLRARLRPPAGILVPPGPRPPGAPAGSAPVRLRRALLLVLSLWVGAATHVVWDEFTHVHRFGYRHVAWLAQTHGPMDGYRWAQYASGLVGALVIAFAILHWWRSPMSSRGLTPAMGHSPGALRREDVSPGFRAAVLGGTLLATLGGAVTGGVWTALHDLGVRRGLFLIATWGGGAGLVTVLIAAVWFRAVWAVWAVWAVSATGTVVSGFDPGEGSKPEKTSQN